MASPSLAFITSLGQAWDYEPDAWVRTNDSDTNFYAWDLLESSGVGLSFGTVLDDATPDVGVDPTTARLFQGTDGIADTSPTVYGHRSGSLNYYSGFISGPAIPRVDDTISGVGSGSGVGGFTTLVIQLTGQPGQPVAGLTIAETTGWTLTSSLYGTEPDGTGLYWAEFTSPGVSVPFSVDINGAVGASNDYGIDAFSVDTFWTSGASPVLNSRSFIPEPSSALLVGLFSSMLCLRRRRG
ncbi:MAG: hypothetical protein AAGA58_15880 [Verrucomicrobiota bacterium]